MTNAANYRQHIARLQKRYEEALGVTGADGVLLFSGSQAHYYGDDRGIPFQAYGHFCQWLPVNRPDQALLIRPGQRPVYFQVVAADFWYDQNIENESWWSDEFELQRLGSIEEISARLPPARLAYLGEPGDFADTLAMHSGLINPPALVHQLDYYRAYKSEYELEQLRTANRIALQGHEAARQCFQTGGSEFAIHLAYLQACAALEDETPYTNIVALDEKAAILHYQHKRRHNRKPGQVLLIDAGARVNNYGSDVTRTWVTESAQSSVPGDFKALLGGMEALQQSLVESVRPGLAYPALHQAALDGIARLLLDLGICLGSFETLQQENIAGLFMPHGVGHLLGIQVHDVGGHQVDVRGSINPPPAHAPMLRNTRTMDVDMVFTIEPGCYFIPLLLDPQRDSRAGRLINWSAVDALTPCGGIRIEDNVRVTAKGVENLTR